MISTKRTGQGFITLGLLGILLSLLTDLLPDAKAGIQSAQILGIEISMVILLVGIWMVISSGTDDKIEIKRWGSKLAEQIFSLPVIAWVLIGFFISFLFFFIKPMFFGDLYRMEYLTNYLPNLSPIGNDLITTLDLMKGLFLEGKSPYFLGFYPPFAYVFFSPLLLIDDYSKLFMFFTLFSIAAYIILTLILPIKIGGSKSLPVVLLFFLTGLVSYGFQFELERGQFNVFTFLLCLLSIYIFHNHKRHRIFAYLLFSLSIQLKLYTAVLIVMFVDDWMDWKTILRRFAGIGMFNFLLLFIMGAQLFKDFMGSVTTQISTPTWGTMVNHSIKSFLDTLITGKLGNIPPTQLEFVRQYSGSISTALLGIFLLCFIVAILLSHLNRRSGIDTYLLLTCTIGTLIVPVSMDYKLSILAAPMALFLAGLPEIISTRFRSTTIFLVLGMALAYSFLLFPYRYKSLLWGNSFPPLFIILILSTILNFLRYWDVRKHPNSK